jgi:hypothetical protein
VVSGRNTKVMIRPARPNQGTKWTFADSGRKPVSCSSDRGWVDFGSHEESHSVGSKLVEKRREEVHRLELLDMVGRSVVFEMISRYNEQNKVQEESDHLHPFAAV